MVVDHPTTSVTDAVTELVDVVLNLAPVAPEQLAALVTLLRPGGILVNSTVWMPAPGDEARGVRGIDLFVRSDAERVPLAELPTLHARAIEGAVHGKVIVNPPTA